MKVTLFERFDNSAFIWINGKIKEFPSLQEARDSIKANNYEVSTEHKFGSTLKELNNGH